MKYKVVSGYQVMYKYTGKGSQQAYPILPQLVYATSMEEAIAKANAYLKQEEIDYKVNGVTPNGMVHLI